jgi:demethoxyubiquinone hydroxylase (CLK1/Coq7/Cat5 family)
MQITEQELTWLNFYRASELHGGLMLGQLVRRVRDPDLILELTRHSAEEVMHAQLWTETILAVGGRPRPMRGTYQARYATELGIRLGLIEVLCLTQVFERRVYRHFIEHARMPGVHPTVRATLERMVDEEQHHLSWVKAWLDQRTGVEQIAAREAMRRFTEIDARVYAALLVEFDFPKAA